MGKTSVLVGVAVLALGGFTACQPVSDVECGMVLTQDTELIADVTGCTGDGLTVGADDIMVDLNGHTVASTGGAGIVLAGHDGVTLKNGTVSGATVGLSLTDAENLAVRHISASGQDVGVDLAQVHGSRISHTVGASRISFRLVASDGNRIRYATAREQFSSVDNWAALRMEASHFNRISDSNLRGGGDSIIIHNSDGNVLADNDATNSNGFGIFLGSSNHNVLRHNETRSFAAGIVIQDSTDNLVVDNNPTNKRSTQEGNIDIRRSDRTKVRWNQVDTIDVRESAGVVVTNNVVTIANPRPGDIGILVYADAPGARVADNQVTGLGGDGIWVRAPGTVLRDNVANDNGELGIRAVPGVIDRGGNVATGNGDPAQCINVTCSPGA